MSFMYHPDEPKRALIVKASDLQHLRDEEFLNDTVMDFYVRCAVMACFAFAV